MPIYNYKCTRDGCEVEFERFLKMDSRFDPVNQPCPNCGTPEAITMQIVPNITGTTMFEADWKPPAQLNEFLKTLKKNTPGAADFRTY